MDEEVVYEDMWDFTHQKPSWIKPSTWLFWKILRKILKKILRTIYLCSLGLRVFIALSTCRRALYGSQLSHDSPNPAQRTLNSIVLRLCALPRFPLMDSTKNSCTFCWAIASGDVLAGSYTPLSIATISVDGLHHQLLLVLLSNCQWRCPGWVIY